MCFQQDFLIFPAIHLTPTRWSVAATLLRCPGEIAAVPFGCGAEALWICRCLRQMLRPYGGFRFVLGVPRSSQFSIYRWDFPWNKPSRSIQLLGAPKESLINGAKLAWLATTRHDSDLTLHWRGVVDGVLWPLQVLIEGSLASLGFQPLEVLFGGSWGCDPLMPHGKQQFPQKTGEVTMGMKIPDRFFFPPPYGNKSRCPSGCS